MTTHTFDSAKHPRIGDGTFTAVTHPEGPTLAAPQIHVPSDPSLHALVFEDRLSNGERRAATRQAVEQALDGDDFNVVYTEEQQAGIRKEMDRDDSTDRVIRHLERNKCRPHQFGSEAAGHFNALHEHRTAVESHYVPTAEATYEAAAAHISGTPEAYRAALQEHLPHLPAEWHDTLLQHQRQQPESWQRDQLYKVAVSNERVAAAKAPRPEVSVEENEDFRTHPVTALESRIDGLIRVNGDPTMEENIRYLANSEEGRHYGTVNIKIIGAARQQAYRWRKGTPED
jgi:hypothetical protein